MLEDTVHHSQMLSSEIRKPRNVPVLRILPNDSYISLNVYLMYSPSLGKIPIPLQPLCIKEFIMLLCVYFKKNKYMLLCFSNDA